MRPMTFAPALGWIAGGAIAALMLAFAVAVVVVHVRRRRSSDETLTACIRRVIMFLLAAVARDFASQASSAELGSTTLQEIASRSAGSLAGDSGVHGFTLLRQTIAALYPPEFANAEFNAQAKDATVEQAADWVLNLVERWR